MVYLLHIDTATDNGIIALAGDGKVLAVRTNTESRNHAGTINNMITEVLAEAGCSLKELSGIVVCGGPGSYTGLRIGMATAKGLCYALDKPLFAHNRLTLLAYRAYKNDQDAASKYVSLIMAREKEFFIGIYNNEFECLLAPQHITADQLPQIIEKTENIHLITDAPESVINNLIVNSLQIDSDISTDLASWALYAFERYKCNDNVNLATAEPFYLKQVYTHK